MVGQTKYTQDSGAVLWERRWRWGSESTSQESNWWSWAFGILLIYSRCLLCPPKGKSKEIATKLNVNWSVMLHVPERCCLTCLEEWQACCPSFEELLPGHVGDSWLHTILPIGWILKHIPNTWAVFTYLSQIENVVLFPQKLIKKA